MNTSMPITMAADYNFIKWFIESETLNGVKHFSSESFSRPFSLFTRFVLVWNFRFLARDI